MPKVSIIVIIYKVERFLKRCLESLVTQDYENVEIICVVGDENAPDEEQGEAETTAKKDGGSEGTEPAAAKSDGRKEEVKAGNNVLRYYGENRQSCLEMCEDYAKRDERVRVIRQKPQGTAMARNAGLDAATGELIAFVDGDDFIEPTMISVMVDALQKNGADISIVGKFLEYENCADIVPYNGDKETDTRVLTRAEACEIIFYQTGFFLHIWDKLYKRELFEDIRFDKGKKVEDRYVTFKLLMKAEKLVFSPSPQYHFRISEDSGSKVEDNLAKSFEADLLICKEVMDYCFGSRSQTCERRTEEVAEPASGSISDSHTDNGEKFERLLRAGEFFLAYEAMSVIQNDMLYGTYSDEHDKEYRNYVRTYAKSVRENKQVGWGVKQKVWLTLKHPKLLAWLTKRRRKKFLKTHIPYKTDVNWSEIYRKQGVV